MKMCKRIAGLYAFLQAGLLIFALLFPLSVSANSGPIDNNGMPGAAGLAVDEDSPIVVLHEDLTFDYRNHDRYSDINGMVTAAYTMQNPTNDIQIVTMAFPFICRRMNLDVQRIGIRVDDAFVPWQLYASPLRVQESQGADVQHEMTAAANTMLDFDSVLQLIGSASGRAGDRMDLSQQGALYEITEITDGFLIVFAEENMSEKRFYMTQGN